MFKDLDWSGALKRAALTVLFYLGLVYVLNVAIPGSYGGPISLAINSAFLFVIFAFFHAFVERRKRRRKAELQSKAKKPSAKKGESGVQSDEEDEASSLKGRHNPNTSRKKASRRRR